MKRVEPLRLLCCSHSRRWAQPSAHTVRCISSRSAELPSEATNHAKSDSVDIKSFAQIEAEMRRRAAAKEPVPRHIPKELKLMLQDRSEIMDADTLYQQPQIGDVLLVNMSPVVVTQLPNGPGGKIGIANAVGSGIEVPLSSIDVRLGRLVPDSITFTGPNGELGAATHAVLARALREIYVRSTELAAKLAPALHQELLDLGSVRKAAVTLPYIELVQRVVGKKQAEKVTESEFYAVRLGLEHYKLVHKYLLDFQYFGRYTVTVIPRDMERRHLEFLKLPDPSRLHPGTDGNARRFLTDYALSDLPSPEAESCALEVLRTHLPEQQLIGPSDAAEIVWNRKSILDTLEWPRLSKLRYQWFTRAAPPALAVQKDRLAKIRTEWSAPVVCIDPSDVREVDDGLSWVPKGDGSSGTLGIHIADFTSFVDPAELVAQVRRMPVTAHFERIFFSMFPSSLAQQFGLASGKPCLSVLVDLDLKQQRVIGRPRLAAHTLKNVTQLSYSQADEEISLGSGPRANTWAALSTAMQVIRRQRGIGFDVQSELKSHAARMVAECMIYACSTVAQVAVDENLPVLFRTQRVFLWSNDDRRRFDAAVKQGPLGFLWRDSIRKSVVSTKPAPHVGLGVEAYTQFTSPLRRGEDVLAHIQIGSYLMGGKPLITGIELEEMAPWIQVGTEIVKEASRGAQRFERLRALENCIPGDSIKGIFSAQNDQGETFEAWLPDYDLTGELVEPVAGLDLDTEAWFTIKRVSAIGNILELTMV